MPHNARPARPTTPVLIASWWIGRLSWRWRLVVLVGIGYAVFVVYILLSWRTALLTVGVLIAAVLTEIFISKPRWLGQDVLQSNLTALTFIVVGSIAPLRVPSTELYKAAAQVLPVLLLTYVVDKRRDFHAPKARSERVSIFLILAYIVTAAYTTFDVLAYDNAERGYANVVIAALAATVVSLTISLLTSPRDTRKDVIATLLSAYADRGSRQPEAGGAAARPADTPRVDAAGDDGDTGGSPGGSGRGADS
jgi:hypothetical protein